MKQKQDKLQAIFFSMGKLIVMEFKNNPNINLLNEENPDSYMYEVLQRIILNEGTYFPNRFIPFVQALLFTTYKLEYSLQDIDIMLNKLINKKENRTILQAQIERDSIKLRMQQFHGVSSQANKIAERIYKKHNSPKFGKQKITGVVFGKPTTTYSSKFYKGYKNKKLSSRYVGIYFDENRKLKIEIES